MKGEGCVFGHCGGEWRHELAGAGGRLGAVMGGTRGVGWGTWYGVTPSIVAARAIVWPPAPVPADVFPSATHVSIRELNDNSLSGTMPTKMGSLASMTTL